MPGPVTSHPGRSDAGLGLPDRAAGNRVLVTGGAGFIGASTVSALVRAGARVVVLDDLSTGRPERVAGATLHLGDVRDPAAVASAMIGVDAVVHLAARSSVPDSYQDPLEYDDVNDHGSAVLLDAAWKAGVSRVVLASSAAVYGEPGPLPVSEDRALDPVSPYGASKAAMEALGRSYAHRGLPVSVLRYFNVYGPGQDGAVVPSFVRAAAAGLALPVDGDGRQGRDFVHVTDVARANLLALRAPAVTCNVGTGRLVSVLELAGLVCSAFGVPTRLAHRSPRAGDVRSSVAATGLAARALGWRAQVSLGEGLADMAQARSAALGK